MLVFPVLPCALHSIELSSKTHTQAIIMHLEPIGFRRIQQPLYGTWLMQNHGEHDQVPNGLRSIQPLV
jgi:hypothetical protein